MSEQDKQCSQGSSCQSSKPSGNIEMDMQEKMIEVSLKKIKNKIVVMSGKGGVGKSSIAANLAVGLARKGFKVGLMDVDLHGPSIAKIMGMEGMLDITPQRLIIPWKFGENLSVVSMQALMREPDQAVIWRGPAKTGVIRSFIADVDWGELDYLVLDSPPGTGDEPLTVAQTMQDASAVIVATPQEVALADVRKSISFCKTVNMNILGIIENMGSFKCPHCNEPITMFPGGGGELMANNADVPFLGTIPFDPDVVKACDNGKPIIQFNENSPFSKAMDKIVTDLTKKA